VKSSGKGIVFGWQDAEDGCAKPPLEAACFRLHKHKKADVLPPSERAVILIKQLLGSLQSPAWGARGRVFESLRPDHIIQGVARFYLATPFYFQWFLHLQNHWLEVESSAVISRSEFVPWALDLA
jgi:hypothetical protein